MKNTKKILAFLLSIIMLFSFVGCDIDTSGYNGNSSIESSNTIDVFDDESSAVDSNAESSSTDSTNSSLAQESNVSSVGTGTASSVDPSILPAYSGTAYVVINNNQPKMVNLGNNCCIYYIILCINRV